jgi:hypothetical protein
MNDEPEYAVYTVEEVEDSQQNQVEYVKPGYCGK